MPENPSTSPPSGPPDAQEHSRKLKEEHRPWPSRAWTDNPAVARIAVLPRPRQSESNNSAGSPSPRRRAERARPAMGHRSARGRRTGTGTRPRTLGMWPPCHHRSPAPATRRALRSVTGYGADTRSRFDSDDQLFGEGHQVTYRFLSAGDDVVVGRLQRNATLAGCLGWELASVSRCIGVDVG